MSEIDQIIKQLKDIPIARALGDINTCRYMLLAYIRIKDSFLEIKKRLEEPEYKDDYELYKVLIDAYLHELDDLKQKILETYKKLKHKHKHKNEK